MIEKLKPSYSDLKIKYSDSYTVASLIFIFVAINYCGLS